MGLSDDLGGAMGLLNLLIKGLGKRARRTGLSSVHEKQYKKTFLLYIKQTFYALTACDMKMNTSEIFLFVFDRLLVYFLRSDY